MKRVFLFISAFAIMVVLFSSCLKDKEFQNGTYGINEPGSQSKGVGFPEAVNEINRFAVKGISTPQTILAPFIDILTDAPPSTDVHVVLEIDNSIVTRYNLANGTSLNIPNASQHMISSLTVTIPAGQRFAKLPIVVPNATILSLTSTFALGFKIKSVDEDYRIASNLREVLVAWSVKNDYDGIYSIVSGQVTRYLSPGVMSNDANSGPLGPNLHDLELSTAGPNTVSLPNAVPGGLPWAASNSYVSGIGGFTIDIDPSTKAVTCASTENLTLANWAGHQNKYDPATKTFYLAFRWNPATTTREYEVVLKYNRERN
jgi:hypothetical protein